MTTITPDELKAQSEKAMRPIGARLKVKFARLHARIAISGETRCTN